MNSKQNVILEGLTHKQILDNVEFVIKDSGVMNDTRFIVRTQRNDNSKEMV